MTVEKVLSAWAATLWDELKVSKQDQEVYVRVLGVNRDEGTTFRPTHKSLASIQEVLEDQAATPLASHIQTLLEFRSATLETLGLVRAREDAVATLEASARDFRAGRTASTDEVVAALEAVQDATARVLAGIAVWRRRFLWRPSPFVWRGRNYVSKIFEDGQSLERVIGEGARTRSPSERQLYRATSRWRDHRMSLVRFATRPKRLAKDAENRLLQRWMIELDEENEVEPRQMVLEEKPLQNALAREVRRLEKEGAHVPMLRCPLDAPLRSAALGRNFRSHGLYDEPSRLRVKVAQSRASEARPRSAPAVSRRKRCGERRKLSLRSVAKVAAVSISRGAKDDDSDDEDNRNSNNNTKTKIEAWAPSVVQQFPPSTSCSPNLFSSSHASSFLFSPSRAKSEDAQSYELTPSPGKIKQTRQKRRGGMRPQGAGVMILEVASQNVVHDKAADATTKLPLLELVDQPFKLHRLPTPFQCATHGWWLWDCVPAVLGVGDGCSPRDIARRKAREHHWRSNCLSGVYAIKPESRETSASRATNDGTCLLPGSLSLHATRFDDVTGQWYDHEDGEPTAADHLLWCMRYGQRLALVRGARPNETVWAMATVVGLDSNDATYCLHTDNGAGFQYDPTGERRVRFVFDDGGGSGRHPICLFGFDVDDEFVVVRVDDMTPAARCGIRHGWVMASVNGEPVPTSSSGRAYLREVARNSDATTGRAEIEFHCFSHVLSQPGWRYQAGQRLSVFHITQWCDAVVLRPPAPRTALEALAVNSGSQVRLRVFVGGVDAATSGVVETVTMTLNSRNHSLQFIDAPSYLHHLQLWLEDKLEWGEMFDVARRRCHHRAKGIAMRGEEKIEGPPGVYALTTTCNHASLERAPTGVHWTEVRTLGALSAALVAKRGDARLGAANAVRVLLVDENLRSAEAAAKPSSKVVDDAPLSGETSGPENQQQERERRRRRAKPNQLVEQAITLAETSLSVKTKEAQERAKMTATVNAAARKITTAWIRRSMAHYADIRTAIGQLRSLLMTISATSQPGHPSTHFVPILVKKDALLRVARRLDHADDPGSSSSSFSHTPSILQLYFESAYSRSRPSLYRMLLQILFSGRFILLLDASKPKSAVPVVVPDVSSGDNDKKAARFAVEQYLIDRLCLEGHRVVVAGGDLNDQEYRELRRTFVTLEVRRGSRADHEAGIDAWYLAQRGRFAPCCPKKDSGGRP